MGNVNERLDVEGCNMDEDLQTCD